MKNILITGCSSGIGYDTAHYLNKNGYKVYATARKEEDVKRLKEEGLNSYLLDVTSPKDISTVLDIILKNDGQLYGIFNNAGYGQPGAIEDITTNILKKQFETNFFGLYELTQQALKIMRKQGYGRIIQHSSILGIVSLRFRGAYNASKYAIEGMCDTLRLELTDSDIFVSTINTGPILSDFRKNAIKMLKQNITINGSIFEQEYKKQLSGTEKKDNGFFTKNSDVVIANIIHALESTNPQPRYYNTLATHLLATLKRILPNTTLDKILTKI